MKMKVMPGRVPLRMKSLPRIGVAILLYSVVALALPDAGAAESVAQSNHPIHTDAVSKQYVYDADGCLVGTATSAGNERREYDVLDRLKRYEGPLGVEEYTYFGISSKVRTVKRTTAGNAEPELTTYLYDGGNVIAEYFGDNLTLSKTRVTPGLDDNLSMTVHNGSDTETYYYTQDGLGSARTLTDAAGTARDRLDYSAFGEPRGMATAVDQSYGFTGREANPLSGDMQYRYRNYNPAAGRFDRRDPIGYLGGVNQYAYVANKPHRYTDPFGLKLRVLGTPEFKDKIGFGLSVLCSNVVIGDDGYVTMPCPNDRNTLTFQMMPCEWIYFLTVNNWENTIEFTSDTRPKYATITWVPYDGTMRPDGSAGPGSEARISINTNGTVEFHHSGLVDKLNPNFPVTTEWVPRSLSETLMHELTHMILANMGIQMTQDMPGYPDHIFAEGWPVQMANSVSNSLYHRKGYGKGQFVPNN